MVFVLVCVGLTFNLDRFKQRSPHSQATFWDSRQGTKAGQPSNQDVGLAATKGMPSDPDGVLPLRTARRIWQLKDH